jgi:hypothetical protein
LHTFRIKVSTYEYKRYLESIFRSPSILVFGKNSNDPIICSGDNVLVGHGRDTPDRSRRKINDSFTLLLLKDVRNLIEVVKILLPSHTRTDRSSPLEQNFMVLSDDNE